MAYFRCIGNSTPKYKKYLGQLIERVSSSTPRITSSGCDISLFDYYAFNGVSSSNMRTPNNCWSAIQNDDDAWIQYEFNRLYWFNKITIKCFSNYSGDWVGNIKILGSQNGIDWENILINGNNYELTAPYQEFSITEINLNSNKEYQFIKIQADNNAFTVYNYPSCFFDEIYVYGGVIASSELEDILTGINNPSSDLGVDGQVYLKYADYNSLYDFKEYIEVGNTAGAYIDSGYVLHSTNEYEIKAQYTDTPVNDGYVFGAWRSNGGTFVNFYNNKKVFAVGDGDYRPDFDTNIHIYKATQSDMLFDGSSVGTPNWNLVDANSTTGIFTDGSRKTSNRINNTKIYYIKIWDNNELVRYFVPVERKSDNEAGMLDIVTGIFYDNDGTKSFTVGGTPSITFDYPITQAYSKINSTWQNLIGTDVRKIMSGQKPNFVSVGTFVTENTANAETEVYCGFKPDYIHVEMEFESGHTYADYYRSNNYVYSWWDLRPIENTRYAILNGEDATVGANGETGITRTMNSGFAYRAHGSNTFNKHCTYYAVKMSDENNINPIVFKTWAKFNGDGFYVPIAGKDSGEIDIIFYEENYVNDKYPFWWGSTTSLRIYNNKFQVGYYGSGNFINVGDYSIGEHTCIIDRYGDNKIIFDNVESTTFTEPSSANIPLFFTKQSQNNLLLDGWVGYIKEFKIYDRNNNLICNLYPALVNNVACMYDTVNNKSYYANSLTVMDEIPSLN